MYKIAIIDIDSTVADNSHRAHLVEGKRKDWKAFLHPDMVAEDTLIPGAREGLQHFVELGYDLVFLTGRSESLREVTVEWIRKHLGFTDESSNLDAKVADNFYELLMRPQGDLRTATKVKGELICEVFGWYNTAEGYKPGDPHDTLVVAADDDDRMGPIYRKHGILWLKAPHCWNVISPLVDLPKEVAWRR